MSDKYDGKEDVETTNQNGEDIVIENVPYIIDDEGDKLTDVNDMIICGYEQYGKEFSDEIHYVLAKAEEDMKLTKDEKEILKKFHNGEINLGFDIDVDIEEILEE